MASACLTDDEVDISTIWGYSLDGRQCLGPHGVHSGILGKEPPQGSAAQVGTWGRGNCVATARCSLSRAA